MKDDRIKTLDFDDDFLLDCVEKRVEEGNYLQALRLLNKRNGMYQPNCDSALFAAEIYEALGMTQEAIGAWYHFLDTCNEADFAEGYNGLAVNYAALGNDELSTFYLKRTIESAGEEIDVSALYAEEKEKPKLRLVEDGEEEKQLFAEGVVLFKSGDLSGAKEKFSLIPPQSKDHASAVGLSAMCSLLAGRKKEAEEECERWQEVYSGNVHFLSTYVAVLGQSGKREKQREIASKIARIPVESDDDLFQVALVLCEAKLDEDAYRVLGQLRKTRAYDRNVLYFSAVAACRVGKTEEAIDTLDLLTLLYPRAYVAAFWLSRLRQVRDGEREPFEMEYVNRIPAENYQELKKVLNELSRSPDGRNPFGASGEEREVFGLAFDIDEGRDHSLQLLAVEAALHIREDDVLREVLLDPKAYDALKFYIIGRLTERNADDSFGTVILGLYREYFTRKLILKGRGAKTYLKAYFLVYTRFALLGPEVAERIYIAAENTYYALQDIGAEDLMSETESLAAVIYREAHLPEGERDVERIADLFQAPVGRVKEILSLIL